MPRPLSVLVAVLSLIVGGCDTFTTPESLDVRVEEIVHRTLDEYQSWPFTPSLSGGRDVVVRGTGLAGCGTLEASARRRDSELAVTIATTGAAGPCVQSKWAWQPFVARVFGLEAGEYRVRVIVNGHRGEARYRVTVNTD